MLFSVCSPLPPVQVALNTRIKRINHVFKFKMIWDWGCLLCFLGLVLQFIAPPLSRATLFHRGNKQPSFLSWQGPQRTTSRSCDVLLAGSGNRFTTGTRRRTLTFSNIILLPMRCLLSFISPDELVKRVLPGTTGPHLRNRHH